MARWAAVVLPALTILVAFTGWFDAVTRRAGHLAIAIPLVFLFYPALKSRTSHTRSTGGTGRSSRVSRFDIVLALAAFSAFAWMLVDRERIMWRLVYIDPLTGPDLVFSALAVALVLEATRRTLGMTLVVVALVFIGYALAGPVMPGILEHKGVSVVLLLEHLYMVPEGLFNQVTGVMATYLLVFLTFGSLLRVAGGDQIFMDLTLAASGRWVGGPAKAAVVGSTMMGSVSGSTIANVVTTGTITIPLMKRTGLKPHEAAAVETAAGTGGALMPPVMGAGAFIMAEITGIPLLTILKLDHNNLTALPETFGRLATLEELDVSHNSLTSLPASLGDLTCLLRLTRSHNQLNTLPVTMGTMTGMLYSAVEPPNRPHPSTCFAY